MYRFKSTIQNIKQNIILISIKKIIPGYDATLKKNTFDIKVIFFIFLMVTN